MRRFVMFLSILVFCSSASAETIKSKSGLTVEGTIIELTEDHVLIDRGNDNILRIDLNQIEDESLAILKTLPKVLRQQENVESAEGNKKQVSTSPLPLSPENFQDLNKTGRIVQTDSSLKDALKNRIPAGNDFIIINQKDLRNILDLTYYAVAKKEEFSENNSVRARLLGGLLFKIHEGILESLGTDGRRIATANAKIIEDSGNAFQFFLPIADVQQIRPLLGQGGAVAISFDRIQEQTEFVLPDSSVRFHFNNGDQFPDVKEVMSSIPEETDSNHAVINKGDFLNALKDIKPTFTESEDKGYVFKSIILKFSDNHVTICNKLNQELKQLNIQYNGKIFAIKFNLDYLLEPLENLPDEITAINFTLTDTDQPVVMSSPGYLYFVLPMKLDDEGGVGLTGETEERASTSNPFEVFLDFLSQWHNPSSAKNNPLLLFFAFLSWLGFSFCLKHIAEQKGHPNSWYAWIPILQYLVILDIINIPRWFILLAYFVFIPKIGLFVYYLINICMWGAIWFTFNIPLRILILYILLGWIPFVENYFWWYLAFKRDNVQ